MRRFLDFILKDENIVGHGNFGDIDERYNLLAEKEDVDRSIRQIPQTAVAAIPRADKAGAAIETARPADAAEAAGGSEPKSDRPELPLTDDKTFDHIDDETLRRIYETIHKINEFEKKASELRKLKFVRRDQSI